MNPNRPSNVVEIDDNLHRQYHALFSNMTPAEILDYLCQYFWGGIDPNTLIEREYVRRDD